MHDGPMIPDDTARVPWRRRIRLSRLVWPLAVVVVLAMGLTGFAMLVPAPGHPSAASLPWPDVVYRTLRLFTLNLDLPDHTSPRWWLWAAAYAAPVLVLRGIAELFREQIGGRLVRRVVRPRLVVFGANERGAAVVTALPRPGRWRKAVVVVDTDPAALATITIPGVWTARGDGRTEDSLRRVLRLATDIVVVTGDNARNSAITSAVLAVRPPSASLFVEVEEPGLARTLEQGGRRVEVSTTTFSASGLAAVTVLDDMHDVFGTGTPAGEEDEPPAVALFGTGALVDAVVLELHHRRRVQLLESTAASPAPRVLLFGPDATQRHAALASLMGTELQQLDLEPIDVDLHQVVELSPETARHLARHRRLHRVMVLTPTDLDGGGIAITLARHLGPHHEIVLVTEGATTSFGDEIERQAGESPTLAAVRCHSAPEIAYDLERLKAERMDDRLARALFEVERPGGPAWAELSPARRGRYLDRASALIRLRPPLEDPDRVDPDAERPALSRTAIVSLDAPEQAPLKALGYRSPAALARAGLHVDFERLGSLVPAATTLLRNDDRAAFAAWAEVARLRTDPAALDADLAAANGPAFGDVEWLVLLRRTTLGSPDARNALLGNGASPVVRLPAGDPRSPIVVLGGPYDQRVETGARLSLALAHLSPETTVWASPTVAQLLDDPPPNLRTPVPDRPGPRAASLALWTAVLADGRDPHGVRVVALPRTAPEDLLLARALGATIGRIESPDAPELAQILLNGADGVMPLPDDRATVRAFLRPSCWPAIHMAVRESLAGELHSRYVVRQRAQKDTDDPSLRPWPVLSSWLKRSNLAAVDDIPSKLTVLGMQLHVRPPGAPSEELTAAFDENMATLAELEHGRYTAERLLSGWTSGVRDPGRFVSPHLLPWTELSDEAQKIDVAVMQDVPVVLARHGLGAERAGVVTGRDPRPAQ